MCSESLAVDRQFSLSPSLQRSLRLKCCQNQSGISTTAALQPTRREMIRELIRRRRNLVARASTRRSSAPNDFACLSALPISFQFCFLSFASNSPLDWPRSPMKAVPSRDSTIMYLLALCAARPSTSRSARSERLACSLLGASFVATIRQQHGKSPVPIYHRLC